MNALRITASDRQQHWREVYTQTPPQSVSWYEETPRVSLEFIRRSGIEKSAAIIDIGAGASRLVDHLLALGYTDLSVLDIAADALAHVRKRLANDACRAHWLTCDVTEFRPARLFALWHDRAALHFLTEPEEQRQYVATLMQALIPGGCAVLATFACDGPRRCSGLDVVRYDAGKMGKLLGDEFVLLDETTEGHTTPRGSEQKFAYFLFRRAVQESSPGNQVDEA